MNKFICLEIFKCLNIFEYVQYKNSKTNECLNIFVALKYKKDFLQLNLSVKNYSNILIYLNICNALLPVTTGAVNLDLQM